MVFRAYRKRRDRCRAKSRAYSSFSMTSREFFANEFALAGQTIPHITVTFYGDCVEDLAPNFVDKRIGF
jgi:hypothetical protein